MSWMITALLGFMTAHGVPDAEATARSWASQISAATRIDIPGFSDTTARNAPRAATPTAPATNLSANPRAEDASSDADDHEVEHDDDDHEGEGRGHHKHGRGRGLGHERHDCDGGHYPSNEAHPNGNRPSKRPAHRRPRGQKHHRDQG
jgi:hypothetical protein